MSAAGSAAVPSSPQYSHTQSMDPMVADRRGRTGSDREWRYGWGVSRAGTASLSHRYVELRMHNETTTPTTGSSPVVESTFPYLDVPVAPWGVVLPWYRRYFCPTGTSSYGPVGADEVWRGSPP